MKLAKYRLKAQVEKDEGPSGEGQSPRVEKDEGPEAETLSRLLIVTEGPSKICFLVIIFIYCNFGPTCLEGPCLFLSFCSDTL